MGTLSAFLTLICVSVISPLAWPARARAYVRKWQSSTSGFANHRRHALSLDTVRQRLWVGSESGVAAVFKIGPAVAKPMKNANALKRWH